MIHSVILLAAISFSAPQSGSIQDQLEQAAELRDQYKEAEALAIYLRILAEHPQNFEALTGASYLYGSVGAEIGSKRKDYFERGLQLARATLQLAPQHPETQLVMAWALGGVAQISGARKKVRLAQEIKGYVERAIEMRPHDPRGWYILASWNYQVANAGFWERAAAKLLFGGLPESATIEEAIVGFRRAVELKPDSISYRFELGRALAEAKQAEESAAQLEKALELEPAAPGDSRIQKECRKLLRKLAKRPSRAG